jgi:hypothetical protein
MKIVLDLMHQAVNDLPNLCSPPLSPLKGGFFLPYPFLHYKSLLPSPFCYRQRSRGFYYFIKKGVNKDLSVEIVSSLGFDLVF